MKRRSPTEIGILVIAAFLLVGGSVVVIHPKESLYSHPAGDAMGKATEGYLDYVSKGQSRAYGVIAVLLGAGLVTAVFYRGKE